MSVTPRPVIMIPTYNERDNAIRLFNEVSALYPDVDILFVDDNSPDGTGKALDELAKTQPRLKVLHRSGKQGVGSAHLAGIAWAYENQYQRIITMDCDFTHPPSSIAELLRLADSHNVVVGSRYMKEQSLKGWNLFRKTLTRTGHFLTKLFLNMPYDATGGFRLYNLNQIPRHAFGLVSSKGYSFFFESLYILHFNGFTIGQIPIALPPRTYGHSKMDTKEIFNSLKLLITTCLTTLLNRERFLVAEPLVAGEIDASQVDDQGWDEYWTDHKGDGGIVYDLIAAFYRKFIIKRNLNFFIKKNLAPGVSVLHAGCGSGQVDTDIRHYVKITGLDISVNALNFYKRTNKNYCSVLHGSIFQIPLPAASFDGIYNLGVMEHFTEDEIYKILEEFHRVLKPGGRMVIFWPPEFGASVIFLKGVKWFLESVMGKKNVKLHPDEITRVQSKKHVVEIFEKSRFKVIQYYFGLRDFFTYSIISVEKPL